LTAARAPAQLAIRFLQRRPCLLDLARAGNGMRIFADETVGAKYAVTICAVPLWDIVL
jgi:hypothetical protein